MLRRSGLRPWLWGALCAEDRGGRTWLKLFRRTRFTDSEEEVRKPGAGGRGFGTARVAPTQRLHPPRPARRRTSACSAPGLCPATLAVLLVRPAPKWAPVYKSVLSPGPGPLEESCHPEACPQKAIELTPVLGKLLVLSHEVKSLVSPHKKSSPHGTLR